MSKGPRGTPGSDDARTRPIRRPLVDPVDLNATIPATRTLSAEEIDAAVDGGVSSATQPGGSPGIATDDPSAQQEVLVLPDGKEERYAWAVTVLYRLKHLKPGEQVDTSSDAALFTQFEEESVRGAPSPERRRLLAEALAAVGIISEHLREQAKAEAERAGAPRASDAQRFAEAIAAANLLESELQRDGWSSHDLKREGPPGALESLIGSLGIEEQHLKEWEAELNALLPSSTTDVSVTIRESSQRPGILDRIPAEALEARLQAFRGNVSLLDIEFLQECTFGLSVDSPQELRAALLAVEERDPKIYENAGLSTELVELYLISTARADHYSALLNENNETAGRAKKTRAA